MKVVVVLPFRDRGDPLRRANKKRVLAQWRDYGYSHYVSGDGRSTGQFCRSAAYNRGVAEKPADVYVFAEADMLIDYRQIDDAIQAAAATPGLVVPFTLYRYLSPQDSQLVRDCQLDPVAATPEYTMSTSIGAINVVSRETYELAGGFDEQFTGNGYDDDAMKLAFEVCAGPTRYVDGPAHHLYHKPAWYGLSRAQLTREDRAATAANRARLTQYRRAKTPEQIRALVFRS